MIVSRKTSALAGGVAALALAGGLAAAFTTANTAPQNNIGAGTLAISIDAVAPTTWTADISNLAAGDSMSRYLNLRNSGTITIANASLAQTNTLGTLLTAPSDVSVKLESCSVPWTQATGACTGTLSTVLGDSSLTAWTGGTTKALTGFDTFAASAVKNLKLTTTLNQAAPNTVQTKTGTITYTFSANQRASSTAM